MGPVDEQRKTKQAIRHAASFVVIFAGSADICSSLFDTLLLLKIKIPAMKGKRGKM